MSQNLRESLHQSPNNKIISNFVEWYTATGSSGNVLD
jgi:hypothetical protein